MSMRVDSSTAYNIIRRWDREETQDVVSAMSREMGDAAEGGKFGRSDADIDVGLSLAASLRDPIFWKKLNILLSYRFDV